MLLVQSSRQSSEAYEMVKIARLPGGVAISVSV